MRVSMPTGSAHGWGIAGTYLAAEMAKLPPVAGVTLHCIAGHDLRPWYPDHWDRINIGYCFFEQEQEVYPFIASAAGRWDHIVAGSRWCEEHLRRGGMSRTSTILQGIDAARFSVMSPRGEDGRFIVFSGGKFEFRKGQDIVIAAMRTFMERHKDVWLSCSWHNQWLWSLKSMEQSALIDFAWRDASCPELLRETIVRSGLDPSRVLLHPPLDNSRMPLIYGESDIGVFPNRCEGGNNMVMCEYMACGRTVIASDRTGHADVITSDNAYRLTSYKPVVVNGGEKTTGNWFEASPGELLELLELAYADRAGRMVKAACATNDMAGLTWCAAAQQFHALAQRLSAERSGTIVVSAPTSGDLEALFNAGEYKAAEKLCREMLRASPFDVALHNSLAAILDRQERYLEAIAHYNKVLALRPALHTVRCDLANTLARAGRRDDAIAELRTVVTQDPEHLLAWSNLEHYYREQENREETARCLEQVIRLKPGDPECWRELANLNRQLQRYREALTCVAKVLEILPDDLAALNEQGMVLHELGELDEAEASFMKALSIDPDNAKLFNNLGNLFKTRRMLNESLSWYDRAHKADPDNPTVIFNRSLIFLTLGEYHRGWPDYERRFDTSNPVVHPRRDIPLWNGEPLQGRRLLIEAEQVYGDTFMFARFAKVAARCGGPVVFECQEESVRKVLVATLGDDMALLVRGEPLPDVDVKIPLLSLPRLFNVTLDTIPFREGYLAADPDRIAYWRRLLPPGNEYYSIGLVWGGRKAPLNSDRSMRLTDLEPLFSLPNARFFSLQLGDDAEQIAPYRSVIEDLSSHLTDFGETAAAIATLDLVITIDTAVAHLAGALGRPVRVLLKHSSDWRWLLERDDSPWYASARLYRQHVRGDWKAPVAMLRADLKKIMTTQKYI